LLTVLRLINSYARRINNLTDENKLKEYLKNSSANIINDNTALNSDLNEENEIEKHMMIERKSKREGQFNKDDINYIKNNTNNIDVKLRKDGGNFNFNLNNILPKAKTNYKFQKKAEINFPFDENVIDREITQEDIQAIDGIEEILSQLEEVFKCESRDRIFDVLGSVSFNLVKAYLILADSEYYQGNYQ
jgi:hypothetical protein